jgi:hypothetical protein
MSIPDTRKGGFRLSHLVTIATQVKDPEAVKSACRRLGLDAPVQSNVKFFDGSSHTGLTVKLPGWRYPVVCDTAAGAVHYDNFRGYWGEQSQFDRFISTYAAEKAKIEARRRGHRIVSETVATDGTIRLEIAVSQ